MKVNREQFLVQLDSVQPGLSQREILEQSNCVVFDGGYLRTYNDEITCSLKTNLQLKGAVKAKPLQEILRELVDDELELSNGDGALVITGKSDRVRVTMESEVNLPIDAVEKPGQWRPLPKDFNEAISIVQECAGKDESMFNTVCVHITPNWMEAIDMIQACRYMIKTGVTKPFLTRREAIRHVPNYGMTDVSETEGWIHFKNPSGLIVSFRRYLVDDYPDLAPVLKTDGKPITIPKGLIEASKKASIFSKENSNGDRVQVDLRNGKLRLTGEGISGSYEGVRSVKYAGPPLSFTITPKLLAEITTKYNDAIISPERLKVSGGSWVYVTALGTVDTEA